MRLPGEERPERREEIRPVELDDKIAERIGGVLRAYARDVDARQAVLVDVHGRRVAQAGQGDFEQARALAAASFELARLMRDLLGRQGAFVRTRDVEIELTPVDDRRLLATVFAGPLDRVRVEAAGVAVRLRLMLEEIASLQTA